jgi:microcompartment protein CcmL/EutN
MTLKRASLTASIKKDLKDTPVLNEKVELPKPQKNLDEVTKELEKLHPENKEIKLENEVIEANDTALKTAEKELDETMVRSTIHLPKTIHKKIKMYCTQNEINLKTFMEDAVIEKAKKLGLNSSAF